MRLKQNFHLKYFLGDNNKFFHWHKKTVFLIKKN